MDKPLLVSGPLIKPIQTGRKTITRRLNGLDWVNVDPDRWEFVSLIGDTVKFKKIGFPETCHLTCPYGVLGSTIWVRENWFVTRKYNHLKAAQFPEGFFPLGYAADYLNEPRPEWSGRVRPSIHLPKWMCRIFLEVTATGVERLHAITEESAKLEGVTPGILQLIKPENQYREAFRLTWINLNEQESWDLNPWVWVVSFKLKNQTK